MLWVLPVFILLIFVDKINPFKYLKLKIESTKTFYWIITILAITVIIQILLLEFGYDKMNLAKAQSTWFGFTTILIAPITEEILFRGYIQQKLTELYRFQKALLITSILFVAIHFPGWLLINSVYDSSLFQLIDTSLRIFFLSLFLGWLVHKTKSLYPSILVHSGNNFISAI